MVSKRQKKKTKINMFRILEILGFLVSIFLLFFIGTYGSYKISFLFILIFIIFLPGFLSFYREYRNRGTIYGFRWSEITWFEKVIFSIREGIIDLAYSIYLSLIIAGYATIFLLFFTSIQGLDIFNILNYLKSISYFNQLVFLGIIGCSIGNFFGPLDYPNGFNLIPDILGRSRIIFLISMWTIFVFITGILNPTDIINELKTFYEFIVKT